MNEKPDEAFPPTPEDAERLGEPYIPWHPRELKPERGQTGVSTGQPTPVRRPDR